VTLLELLVAMGIGTVVGIMALTAYMGANKAQAITVGSHMLSNGGQRALSDIYKKLNGARRLYDRGAATNKFLANLPIAGYTAGGLTPGATLAPVTDVLLPRVVSGGSFAIQQVNGAGVVTNNAAFDQDSVGNALFFLAKDPRVAIHEPGGSSVQATAFGTADYYVQPYRFHFLFLVRRPLPINAPAVRPADSWTYQLMHWDSLPYLDRADLEAWMAGMMRANGNSSATQTYINTKLAALAATFPGAVDFGEDDPDNAMFQLAKASPTDYLHLRGGRHQAGQRPLRQGDPDGSPQQLRRELRGLQHGARHGGRHPGRADPLASRRRQQQPRAQLRRQHHGHPLRLRDDGGGAAAGAQGAHAPDPGRADPAGQRADGAGGPAGGGALGVLTQDLARVPFRHSV